MTERVSRRESLGTASAAAARSHSWVFSESVPYSASRYDQASLGSSKGRIVDMHVHFDEQKPNFIPDLLKVSDRLNLTASPPERTRKVIMGGTLSKMLGLPE